MYTRIMVSAFLSCQNKMLLIHRGLHKEIAPGLWSCIGGHMEPEEMYNPLLTCCREIEEETGITKDKIQNLELRYIATRYTGEEIRMGYYFVGETCCECALPACDEGSLHWVDKAEIPEKPMSFTIREITMHHLANPESRSIFLCGVNRENDKMSLMEM